MNRSLAHTLRRRLAIGLLSLVALSVSVPAWAQSSDPPDWAAEITAFDARRQSYLRDRHEGYGPHASSTAPDPDADPRIAAESAAARVQLAAAIATFERFLRRTPDDRNYTPSALLRLAELYHDRATLESDSARTAPDERCAIAAYRIALARFPSDRLRDTTLYLLGWALAASGRNEESLSVYRSLVCANVYSYVPVIEPLREDCTALSALAASAAPVSSAPASPSPSAPDPHYDTCEALHAGQAVPTRYAAEVWYRVGDLHFDDARGVEMESQLSTAIVAYRAAIRMEGLASPPRTPAITERARYKIAWSFHRMEHHEPDALREFAALLDSIPPPAPDTLAALLSSGAPQTTDATNVGLARDSIQWLATILGDGDWEAPSRRDEARCRRLIMATSRTTRPRDTHVDCAGILRVTDPRSMQRLTLTPGAPSAPAGATSTRWWMPFVWLAMARSYLDQTEYPEAITMYTLFLQRYPAHPGAAIVTHDIATAHERLGGTRESSH